MATPQGGQLNYNINKPKPTEESNSEEVDDTTEEDDTEGASDNENEDTESESEGEESESSEDEKGGKEETVEQYLDVSKLPPELREIGKRMLNTHTKNQAKLKKELETARVKLEERFNEEYSEAVVKSAGFDKLTKLAEFSRFWEDVSNGRPYGYSSDFRKGKPDNEEEDSSAEADGKAVSVEALAKKLMPAITKLIDDRVGPIRQDHAKNVWAEAEKNLPNFSKYRAAIATTLTKHPTMSIQEAYDMVSAKDKTQEAIQKALNDATETGKKVPKKTLKPGSESGQKRDLDKKTINSIDKALNFARSDLMSRAGG